MPANLRDRARLAKTAHRDRFAVPQLAFDPAGIGWCCPYRDEDRGDWEALLFEAFGTRSLSVVNCFLTNIEALCDKDWDATAQQWQPDVVQMNTAIAVMASTNPADEAQACIAAQMVSLHFTAMKLGGVASKMNSPDERTAATMARVSKAYASLARTLAQLQGKVSRSRHDMHVTYYDQRDQRQQTVVMGGGGQNGGQPHASKEIIVEPTADAGRAALPSPCANGGAAMSFAGSEGQARMPTPRWRTWLWRALGR